MDYDDQVEGSRVASQCTASQKKGTKCSWQHVARPHAGYREPKGVGKMRRGHLTLIKLDLLTTRINKKKRSNKEKINHKIREKSAGTRSRECHVCRTDTRAQLKLERLTKHIYIFQLLIILFFNFS